jgi:signal transduction histidine kinase/ligand-binding sensor domain-containing protein
MVAILLPSAQALAQSSPREITWYSHTAWTVHDGLFAGRPTTLAQTTDGFLWVGTDSGLFRFDGSHFAPFSANASPLPSTSVIKLLGTRDGSLWIGTTRGLARWAHGRLSTYLGGDPVVELLEDRDGAVWIGTHGGKNGLAKLCNVRAEQLRCDADSGKLGRFVASLHQTPDRTLWVGGATGLWQWRPTAHGYTLPYRFPEVHAIVDDEDGILIAVNRDLIRLTGQMIPTRLPPGTESFNPTTLYRASDGRLWIGTQDRGVFRLSEGRTDRVTTVNGLSGDFVVDILEDREQNVWVATLGGIDRITDRPIAQLSIPHGLSAATVTAVLGDRKGRVWVGTVHGLNVWSSGRLAPAGPPAVVNATIASLFEDANGRVWVATPAGIGWLAGARWLTVPGIGEGFFRAIAEDRGGNLWVAEQERGLYRFRDGRVTGPLPWSALRNLSARSLVADPTQGIWIGFQEGGVAYLDGDQVRRFYTAADGLGAGEVMDLRFDTAGTLWVATATGLSRIAHGTAASTSRVHGLPCDGAVRWLLEDGEGALWLRMECGLVRLARSELDAWSRNPSQHPAATLLDDRGALAVDEGSTAYTPPAARASDGRIWFRSTNGVRVFDPRRARITDVVPLVRLDRVTINGRPYTMEADARLPPGVREVTIDFTATSLTEQNRTRFRYMLEGRDAGWREAGTRRQATYTDLAPGSYRFRAAAANGAGIWGTVPAVWAFSVRPELYETRTFRIALPIVGLTLLWWLYQLRLRRFARLMKLRHEARLAERTRIAKDLHDTLLQGLVSVSMQLDVVVNEHADHPARGTLQHILQRVRDVVEEGRRTVNTLRVETPGDLETGLTTEAERLRGVQKTVVRTLVNGDPRPLVPAIRHAAYWVGREALANAFQHSRATAVEIMIGYSPDEFTLRVSDDGVGIDPAVITAGRRLGHWGVPGMKEQAEQVGAKLRLWSRPAAGTEIEISIPARSAFERRGDDAVPRLELVGWWKNGKPARHATERTAGLTDLHH